MVLSFERFSPSTLAMHPETYVAYAILLAVPVGIFQLLLGNLKLGVLVDFLSHPVVVGFTNAAAVIIVSFRIGKLFRCGREKAEHQYETLWNTLVFSPACCVVERVT